MKTRRVLEVLSVITGLFALVLLIVEDLTRGYVDGDFSEFVWSWCFLSLILCVVFAFAAALTDT